MYVKHIEKSIIYFTLKERFHVKSAPFNTPPGRSTHGWEFFFPDKQTSETNTFAIHSMELESEYASYKEEYTSLINILPDGTSRISRDNNYLYWKSKLIIWPNLSRVALWWNAHYTSSIAAERAFGLARLIDSTQRGSMGWDTFARELKFRVNSMILDEQFRNHMQEIKLNYL